MMGGSLDGHISMTNQDPSQLFNMDAVVIKRGPQWLNGLAGLAPNHRLGLTPTSDNAADESALCQIGPRQISPQNKITPCKIIYGQIGPL